MIYYFIQTDYDLVSLTNVLFLFQIPIWDNLLYLSFLLHSFSQVLDLWEFLRLSYFLERLQFWETLIEYFTEYSF
jgi:hypothetical protein